MTNAELTILMAFVLLFLALIVVGLLLQHSLRQARQALMALDFNLQHFRHELADTPIRLKRLEHMAHWPEASQPASLPDQHLNLS
jgi:hypothetical protein